MVSIKINNVSTLMEFPLDFLLDGTEEFNIGKLKLKNTSQREAYPDWEDVVLTINSVDYEMCIQSDNSVRSAPSIYDHDLVLVEPVMKLSQYYMADRLFTTIDGAQITYKDQIENMLPTINLGKTNPFTVNSDTLDLLDSEIATEKEYSGGNLLTQLLDMFRSVKAVPTLTLDNEIEHEMIGAMGSKVTLADLIGETVFSDVKDYAQAVHSKIKQGTYEGEDEIGATWHPAENYGVTPRSTKVKYDDDDAEYILDTGIRRIVQANFENLNINPTGIDPIAEVSRWIIPKAEWDDLEEERTTSVLVTGLYRNNTFYFEEGSNIIKNVGVKYKNSSALITGDDAMEWLIKSYLDFSGRDYTTQYIAQNIVDMEMRFKYQAIRDMDVRLERHDITRVNKNATMSNNQKDSTLDLQRYGSANKSLINRVGNDTYEVTIRYNNLTAFTLPFINDYIEGDYKIVKMQFLVRDNSMDITYQLVKNASILNPITQVNRAVSPFTIQKRNILSCFTYNEYIEFSATNKSDSGNLTLLGRKSLFNQFRFDNANNKPLYNTQYLSGANGNVRLNLSAMCVPMGNTILLNAQFNAPKVAGYQITNDGIAGHKLVPIPYTDENGQVQGFAMHWHSQVLGVADDHPVGLESTDYLVGPVNHTVNLNPNEILGLSHHLHFITDRPELIIHEYMGINNSLVKELFSSSVTLYTYDGDVRFNIDDIFIKSGSTGTGTYSMDTDFKTHNIGAVGAGDTWALADTTTGRLYMTFNYDGTNLRTVYANSLDTDRPDTEVL